MESAAWQLQTFKHIEWQAEFSAWQGSRRGDKSAFIHRRFNGRTILEQDAAFLRIDQRVITRTFRTEPKVLNGMRVWGLFVRSMRLVEPEKCSLAVVKGNLAGGICAGGDHRSLLSHPSEFIRAEPPLL